MSTAVGFRAFPDGFAYVVLSGTQSAPSVGGRARLTVPVGQEHGGALCWVRKQVVEMLEAHRIDAACIKTVEPMARKKSAKRAQIEGVIMEALYTVAGVECVPRIKSQLKRDIRDFKEPARYLTRVLSGSEHLESLNNVRLAEATIAAVAALPAVE